MDPEQLASRFPTLWHLCASDDPQAAWTGLQHEGLLSVEALADANGVHGQERRDLLTGHRPQPVELASGVVVRDTKPMPEGMLRHVVHGETPQDWRARLNGLVFFHPGGQSASPEAAPRRHKTLWDRYSTSRRLVIVLDTHRVAARVGAQIRLSPINTGAARMASHVRGPNTIRSLADWPSDATIAEVAVPYRLDDLLPLIVKASIWNPQEPEIILFRNPTLGSH